MREIDLIHRQIELVAVSVAGRVQRLYDALHGLSFMTKRLFAVSKPSENDLSAWIEQQGITELETGFFESVRRIDRARAEGPDFEDAVLFWPNFLQNDVEVRRRFYILHGIKPYVAVLHRQIKGIAWIYFQSAYSRHTTWVSPVVVPEGVVPPDFNWHEYHSFTIAEPKINPKREIRWSPPNVDYGGQGLISCVSIPVYADDDTFLGVWTMDVRLAELHADLGLQRVGNVGERQTNFITDYAGKLIAHPALDPAASAEKGSVHEVMLATLGGDFRALDVPALSVQGHGQIEVTDAQGQRLVVAFRTVPDMQWIIYATFPTADMIEATQAAFKRAFDKLGSGDLSFRLDAVGDDIMQQLVASFNEMTHTLQDSLRRREEAEAEKSRLAFEQERLARELEIAATIQLSMLPRVPKHAAFEFAGLMKPADEVGGDFYDVLVREDKLWITVGDVSSHGLGAGLVMMVAQAVFQSVFEANPDAPADEVLQCVNRLLYFNMSKGVGRGHYLTGQAFLHRGGGVFDCVGGHLWPLIINQEKRIGKMVDVPGPWLGIVPHLPRIPVTRITLAPGEILCLYSDGITEARNSAGEFFGVERLQSELVRIVSSQRPLDDCTQQLLDTVSSFAATQDDDRTILLVRYTGN